MLLSVQNNLDQLPSTLSSYTSTNIASGGTIIPLKNINSFSYQWAVQVGRTGEEQSEVLVVASSPSGTAVDTSGTVRFDHPMDTPVYNIHYDKIIFKRSTVGTVGTATAIATVSITPDSFQTEYNDSSGAISYAYKTQYYNSLSGDTSSESDWFVPGGPSSYSLQKLRKRAMDRLFNKGFLPDTTVIDDWINDWIELMTNSAIKVNKGYAIGTVDVTFGTAGYGTINSADFKQANKVEVIYSGGTPIPSSKIEINGYSASDVFSGGAPRHSWLGDNTFIILPAQSGGTARLTYSKRNALLTNETDELPYSLRSYTAGCTEYVLYCAYDNDEKESQANSHYNKFLASKSDFINEITPRDQTGIQMMDFVESLSGREEDIDVI